MTALRLGIDLDGVVCDFPTWANGWLTQELECAPIDVDRWDWYKGYGESVEPVWERLWSEEVPGGFFADVPDMPGALDSLEVLRGQGHQLVFITSRPATAAVDTEEWLTQHGFGGHHLILSLSAKTKLFTDTDILLDDKGETVARHVTNGKRAVLFKRPWNKSWWPVVPSVSGWSEFIELVKELAGE